MVSTGDYNKNVLKGVPELLWGGMGTYTDDLMVVSALRLCLDYLGDEYSKAYLAGTSGAAFETGWARSTIHSGAGGAIFAHPNHCEAGFDNVFRAIGRKYAIAYKWEPDQLWNLVVESIDAGRPVIATEWKVDHFAILAGYEVSKMELVGRRYRSREDVPEEYVPIRVDEIGYVLTIGEKEPPVSPAEAARGALRFAVLSGATGTNTSARGQAGTSHEMIYGPEAFAEHARLVPHQLNPDLDSFGLREHFLFWRLDALHLARGYAVLYLQEIVEQLPQSARPHVSTAVERYCELIGMIRSVNIDTSESYQLGTVRVVQSTQYVDLYPPQPERLGSALLWCDGDNRVPLKQFLGSVQGRESFAAWLSRMGDVEAEALKSLAKALQAQQ